MIFEIELILLLSLFSPLTEAFPNLYMSWWTPSNGNLKRYVETWPRRVLVVLTVWAPILIIMSRIIEHTLFMLILVALIFSAFGVRHFVMDRYLKQEIKKAGSGSRSMKIPELFYLIAFSIMGVTLYQTIPDNQWLVPTAILTIFLGANIIGTFRYGKRSNITLDIVGRLTFITGFLLFLYTIIQASLGVA